ncbi:helix-turn-helix domain-containing protein [Martelella lutilitoris]|uniref:Helix-turn-helix domain-containing protein n=1 Tax=Martelella lutilitoris TaxID=2583532 RepID=A0A7T7HH85_9HYPH|nr:S24 family peptidase [Martelella lutilitoris]QQM29084.1 helix-turn-helix domain-containing protein [Martelella lutilitoris]
MAKKEDPEELAFRKRVRDAIQAGGKSGEMAKKTGIPVGTLNKYVALTSTPSGVNAIKIAKALNLTVEQLADGDMQSTASQSLHTEDMVSVRFQDLRVSAGPGLTVIDERNAEMIGLSRRILNELGLSPLQTLIMMVDGDSMSPTITDGAVIFVDRNERQLREGKVYVLSLAGDLVVKRIQLDFDGGVTLLSDADGPAFPPRKIDPVDVEHVNVVGRVVCAMSPV